MQRYKVAQQLEVTRQCMQLKITAKRGSVHTPKSSERFPATLSLEKANLNFQNKRLEMLRNFERSKTVAFYYRFTCVFTLLEVLSMSLLA